jgi:hypothetical protein
LYFVSSVDTQQFAPLAAVFKNIFQLLFCDSILSENRPAVNNALERKTRILRA